jgi:hypothetical protein
MVVSSLINGRKCVVLIGGRTQSVCGGTWWHRSSIGGMCSAGRFMRVGIGGQLWLIFATERKEKVKDGRKATVRVQIPKSKDIETWQYPNSFRSTLVSAPSS